jgi:mevalonate kinase
MPIVLGKAPGKIILFGEHAVVYGQPAIAIPVTKVTATTKIIPDLESAPGRVRLRARQVGLDADLADLAFDQPLAKAVRISIEAVAPQVVPAFMVEVESEIPVSAGMGSSAAISIAMIRAVSAFLGGRLSPEKISELAYEVEKIHHGAPSGIDNNVIAHQKPVYFIKDKPIRFLKIKTPTHWVIADTGEKTPTRETVAAVRALHAAEPQRCDSILQAIGALAQKAQGALEQGNLTDLGCLMNENQRLLEQLNVSSARLNALIQAARTAGASGAKLSGGGRGGNMIALVTDQNIQAVEKALEAAGAERILTTKLTEGRMP